MNASGAMHHIDTLAAVHAAAIEMAVAMVIEMAATLFAVLCLRVGNCFRLSGPRKSVRRHLSHSFGIPVHTKTVYGRRWSA